MGGAAVVSLDANGNCSSISIGVTGAGAKPFRMTDAESTLSGTKLEEKDVREVVGKVGDLGVDWMSDLFGSEEYRQHLVGVVAGRAIAIAKGRAQS